MEKLGIIKDEDGNVLRHRTLLKLLLNPILRKFGCSIVSSIVDKKFAGYQIRSYPENCRVLRDDE